MPTRIRSCALAAALAVAACGVFAAAPASGATTTTIWSSTALPAGADSDAAPVELGVRFRSDVKGFITGVRFYKYATNSGTHLGHLWSSTGVLLAAATFTAESASGWQQVTFSAPVAIDANTTYVASYHTNTGHYGANSGYFAAGVDHAPLHAPADSADGPNGVYRYGAASAFPDQSYRATNYWVDVVFEAAAATEPPPTPSATPGTCPCDIWGTTAAVGAADVDASPVELGVRFRADTSGFITGVRFYKHANNSGTHIGTLWTNTGTRLATATFTSETTSGWQAVSFAAPVAVTANTTYVASYHTDTGHYAASSGYFVAGADHAPLHALPDGADGPSGVYVYGTGSAFPNQTYRSTNYWVDVVFVTVLNDSAPPTITSVSPVRGAIDVTPASGITITFNEPMDAATINSTTVELRNASGALVPSTVSYGTPTGTATLQPASPLAYGATYTVNVRGGVVEPRAKDLAGNAMAASDSWSFTTLTAPPAPGACPCTIWPASTMPAVASTDVSAIEVGLRFRADTSGYITGLRFYKTSDNTGVHVATLWTNSGAVLARATFVAETAFGWQQVSFAAPIAITANTTYVASYHSDSGHYAFNGGFFSSSADRGPLHALRDGVDGPNGVYRYSTSSAFPNQTYSATNYWVDVVFTTSGSDTAAPVVNAPTPAAGATGVAITSVVTATFNEMMAASSFNATTFELRTEGGTVVPASVLVGGETPTVTLTPTSPLAYGTTYTATVQGGAGGVTDLAGNVMAANYSWSFTTVAAPTALAACPCTIWSASTMPAGADSDPNSIQIGVKFQSSTAGYITALRFYKFPENTGVHVGELWTRAGARLAVVTFANETPSGWQQATLPNPVAIAANTTYIASYHTDVGHYAVTPQYFASGAGNAPLRALSNSEDGGNGVYRYGPAGVFPAQTYHGENYWVDVVFATTAPDTTAPLVTKVAPASGTSGVPGSARVTVTFDEAMSASTIHAKTFELRDGAGLLVPASVGYDASTRTATLTPANVLTPSTTFTARIKGGTSDPRAQDAAGNALASDATWLFTTAAAPLPTDGPGGPILVVRSAANPFSAYYVEILRAEGLNAFAVADIAEVSSSMLAAYDVVLLGEMPVTAAQAAMFGEWVTGGGNLIAMRPDRTLASLLGLTPLGSTLDNAYLSIDGTTAPGAGIASQALQFHGTADAYAAGSAKVIAALYSTPRASTPNPAVTLADVGANGGHAAAFTYDLARSIVYTRQGNPAWAGQDRDGNAPVRPNDLFYGAAAGDVQPDWIDLENVAIPQADEQQRLLVNLILHMNRSRKPLPRFWYFPRGARALIVMTADDRATGASAARFDALAAASLAGCSVANWECVRATSYVTPQTPLANASAYVNNGFEIALQVDTKCQNWSADALEAAYADQLTGFAAMFPGVPAPATHRAACSAWSDYATQPRVETAHGMRLDTSYTFGPSSWIANRPGFFTGSGLPMRFVDATGRLLDVYQSAAHMSDDAGQTYPTTVNALLDKAIGPEGYYGAFTAHMRADFVYSFESDQIVASARERGVSVVSARQLLDWLDGRNGSSFHAIVWNGPMLSFSVAVGAKAHGLQAMLPTTTSAGTLRTISVNGNPVAFTRQTIKGVEYALFVVMGASYQASYAP